MEYSKHKSFNERSEKIKDAKFVNDEYKKLADASFDSYLERLYGASLLSRIINKFSGHRLKKKINRKRKYAIKNLIECETHRELFLEGF